MAGEQYRHLLFYILITFIFGVSHGITWTRQYIKYVYQKGGTHFVSVTPVKPLEGIS